MSEGVVSEGYASGFPDATQRNTDNMRKVSRRTQKHAKLYGAATKKRLTQKVSFFVYKDSI